MSEPIDDLARTVAERTSRRGAVAGLGTLALGALGLAGIGPSAEAKKNKHRCNKCKDKCRRKNKKKGRRNKDNCGNKCDNKCKNT